MIQNSSLVVVLVVIINHYSVVMHLIICFSMLVHATISIAIVNGVFGKNDFYVQTSVFFIKCLNVVTLQVLVAFCFSGASIFL